MKAVVQDRYGSPDVLELREVDTPNVADDRVLVRVRAASVNALDWHFMRGKPFLVRLIKGLGKPREKVRGVDIAGTVEAVGKGITRWKTGDEVFGTAGGAFAEYASAIEGNVATKPTRLSFDEAAALPIAGFTALEGLRDHGKVKAGQRVLICGAGGGVGTFAVQIAKAFGAHVTAVTGPGKLELVRSIGADEVIDYTREDFTRGVGRYDVVLDISGDRSFAACRRVLGKSGVLVVVGSIRGGLRRKVRASLSRRFLRHRVVSFIAKGEDEDLVTLRTLVDAGKLTPVIDRRYPLSQVPDAMRYMETYQARGKVVITVA